MLHSSTNDGSERAFEKLYQESYKVVYNYICARMNNDAATEDIVAEAYLKAARAFNSFDPARAKFSTWVITIAHNCMISYYRKQRSTATLDDVPESFASVPDSQEALANRDLAVRLLRTLNETELELVLLKYQEGLRNADIAQRLDMNASTVSTTLSRALAKMRSVAERNK